MIKSTDSGYINKRIKFSFSDNKEIEESVQRISWVISEELTTK